MPEPARLPIDADVLRYVRDGRHRSVVDALESARADLDVLLAKARADRDPSQGELLGLSQRIADIGCAVSVVHMLDSLLHKQ